MYSVTLPYIGTAEAWRDKARQALALRIPPEDIVWHHGRGEDLFATPLPEGPNDPLSVPKSFASLANSAVWHSDPQRFGWLYTLLWQVKDGTTLMSDRGDPLLAKLRQLEKNVHRCQHKMKAFVRFRDITPAGANRRQFVAWFEPSHFTVEPTAPFFARRFGDMDWMIATPHATAAFRLGEITIGAGQEKPDLPDDATEELWATYYQNIFNPARVKISAMTSEMPRKYWKNMPETRHIPEMLAKAEERVRQMQEAMPTLPPVRAAKITESYAASRTKSAPVTDRETLERDIRACTRCPLHCNATQAVVGEGPITARLMIVGEQPGDAEDLAGRPFVGPAGKVFEAAAHKAGLDRTQAYVTNAVKHFKFKPQGKRRLHQNPNTSEIEHCKFWLRSEVNVIKPDLIVAMGGTAAEALTGERQRLLKRRGTFETGIGAIPTLITLHPSYILRLPNAGAQAEALADFEADLALAART